MNDPFANAPFCAFTHRCPVLGWLPGIGPATTLLDLAADRRSLTIHPAGIGTFSLILPPESVRMLAATAESGDSCAVPGEHAVHGKRLLCVRPYEGKPAPPWVGGSDALELSVNLPADQSIQLVFCAERRAALLAAVRAAHTELT